MQRIKNLMPERRERKDKLITGLCQSLKGERRIPRMTKLNLTSLTQLRKNSERVSTWSYRKQNKWHTISAQYVASMVRKNCRFCTIWSSYTLLLMQICGALAVSTSTWVAIRPNASPVSCARIQGYQSNPLTPLCTSVKIREKRKDNANHWQKESYRQQDFLTTTGRKLMTKNSTN